ncbi:MAG: hypothetical protein QG594_1863 [Bacteroidota bacterium]|nr:hypothetical protein [Bacteroidota bacterium]
MKISKLNIESYRHLENLNFDFTYQTGERKGQPLDKICFIGQSATGKTGLLELIYQYITSLLNNNLREKFLSEMTERFNGEINFLINEENLSITNKDISYDNKKYHFDDFEKKLINLISEIKKSNAFYIQANLISDKNIQLFTVNPIDLLEKYHEEIKNFKKDFIQFGIRFDDNVNADIWLFLLNDILHYRKNFTQIMTELVHNYITDAVKFRSEYEKWEKDNPNTIAIFGKEFNSILEKINLEVDIINTEYSVPIKNKTTNEIVHIKNTSTGTKQLLLTTVPLFSLETTDTIILIDEPERSLYPDIQIDLIEYYQRLAPNAQFIVATHSPFIAASFEPEERFILYFDEEGKVAVRSGISPIGDDPNDMLKNDFGLEFLMNKEGLKAFERFKTLKKRLASEKDEEEKDKLLSEILVLAKAYKF